MAVIKKKKRFDRKEREDIKMSILFINGSPNKNGNTAELAETLMDGKAYQTLNLVDYKVYGYGQNFADDQFTEIVEQMKTADTIIIGSPFIGIT